MCIGFRVSDVRLGLSVHAMRFEILPCCARFGLMRGLGIQFTMKGYIGLSVQPARQPSMQACGKEAASLYSPARSASAFMVRKRKTVRKQDI